MPRETAESALHREEAAAPEIRPDTPPSMKPAPRDRQIFYQCFQPQAGSGFRRGFKIFLTAALIILVIATLGAGYFAGRHFQAGPVHLQAEEVKARKVVICDAKGKSRALLSEQGGIVRLDLCDAAGVTRASISLGVDAEPRFSLFGKDQQKLKEWKWAAAAPEGGEPVSENIASPGRANDINPRQGIPARYIGSKTSNKYHYPNCEWGKQIVPENLLIFHTVREAKDKGYIQCRACRPPLEDPPGETVKASEIPLPLEFGKMPLPPGGEN